MVIEQNLLLINQNGILLQSLLTSIYWGLHGLGLSIVQDWVSLSEWKRVPLPTCFQETMFGLGLMGLGHLVLSDLAKKRPARLALFDSAERALQGLDLDGALRFDSTEDTSFLDSQPFDQSLWHFILCSSAFTDP